ncbi:unnamed protein product [Cyclocybe aegerita]|uniref:Uncharacterized protein n=1 Tax=Cyclocybe aegerita TaxID=1973307 RepID=A0A8S0WTG3_CYCAE|nr:unnamed protein product [Cyclocybe aegerita]
MLSGQHSGRPIPFVLACFFHRTVLLALVLLQLVFIAAAQDRLNLSIPLNSTQIVYTPFLCNATEVLLNPQTCAGAWQISNLSDGSISSVSTTGPSSASGNIIPQIFFPFRASGLFLTTLPTSNATVNITISASGTAVSTIFESGTGSATIVNLPESEVALLTITFIPSGSPTILELEFLQINVLANIHHVHSAFGDSSAIGVFTFFYIAEPNGFRQLYAHSDVETF